MKKFISLFSLILVLFLLVGCGSADKKEVVKTCKLTQNDVAQGYKLDSTYTIYGKGKVVDRVESVEIVTSDNQDILDSFEELLKSTYEQTNNVYGGYDINVTNENGKIISDVTIDYNKMNLDKFIEDNSAMKKYVTDDDKLLISGVESLYESLGANCE